MAERREPVRCTAYHHRPRLASGQRRQAPRARFGVAHRRTGDLIGSLCAVHANGYRRDDEQAEKAGRSRTWVIVELPGG